MQHQRRGTRLVALGEGLHQAAVLVLAAAVDAWLRGPEWPFTVVRWPGREAPGTAQG